MFKKLKDLIYKEEGQGMTEYGLIIALVAIVVIASILLFEEAITGMFTDITNEINSN